MNDRSGSCVSSAPFTGTWLTMRSASIWEIGARGTAKPFDHQRAVLPTRKPPLQGSGSPRGIGNCRVQPFTTLLTDAIPYPHRGWEP